MKRILFLIVLVGLVLAPAPALAQSYGSNYCRWVCDQTYPNDFFQRTGCHFYCDYFCSLPENTENALCLDIRDV